MITWLRHNKELLWIFFFSTSFFLLNAYLIRREFYYVSYVPFFFLVVMIAIYSIDKLLLLIVFFTPLSIKLTYLFPVLDIDAHLPTEPLMLGLLIIAILKYFHGQNINREFLRHPVSIAIYANLLWIVITSITSTMPVISFKFLLSRIWFVVAFYFVAGEFFKTFSNARKFVWVYTIPMMLVIFLILNKLSGYGFFNNHAAHHVVRPFFVDHTSYGAILALLLPVIGGFLFTYKGISSFQKALLFLVFSIFVIAVILSYTRAAWVSIAGALVIMVLIILRIKFYFLVVIGLALSLALFSYRSQVIVKLEQNRQDSSKQLSEHVKSISNVATDASNLERLNRWSCAWRMFKEKPIFGWGPGTYMFQYSPFQIARERTIISTDFADLGNAHSEYIGPLSESGIMGTLTFLWIVISAFLTGLRVSWNTADRNKRIFGLTVLVGLLTYFIHGLVNNFLDTDKASALFWGFIAILVAFDIQNRGQKSLTADKSDSTKSIEEGITTPGSE